ncbi:hypothetical protein CEXT_265851 [Caerostris extrusa]|uniref:Uncharacterized protein n=1 Tax=Caerostris extrusa TaxID=172846 RepID=A0AAV4P904_CAEEX|nr:hypothetical protein CEXT_265851 [Caerostris extrusa]
MLESESRTGQAKIRPFKAFVVPPDDSTPSSAVFTTVCGFYTLLPKKQLVVMVPVRSPQYHYHKDGVRKLRTSIEGRAPDPWIPSFIMPVRKSSVHLSVIDLKTKSFVELLGTGWGSFSAHTKNLFFHWISSCESYSGLKLGHAIPSTQELCKKPEILHTICVEFEDQVLNNVDQVDFVKCLFSYLQYDQTCFLLCQVLESLILSKKNIYDLSKIEGLPTILMNLDDIQLGSFCKILTVTLSELDMYENKTLYAETQQKKNKNIFIRDTNQDIILGIPNLLSRLVKISCALPYVPWSGAVAHSTLESGQWLSWLDIHLRREIASELRSDTFVGGVTSWSEYNNNGPPRTSIKTTLELAFRADAMCVLGLLLIGRHRKEIQKELTDLRLIPQLSDLFDHFVWKTNARRDSVRLPGHNTSCECSPEVALKIQILRLIHSYCDHSEYKYAMLSWCELSEVTNIEELSEADYPTWLKPSAICSEVVWLSRAIESYVRGNFHCADQDFLLRRNLLSHVVQSLLTSNSRHREILQSSFDLLGELIKFNVAAFTELNSHILTSAKYSLQYTMEFEKLSYFKKKLMSVMSASLVDSNMFIRNLILSYELFVCSGDSDLKVFAEECCNILSHVGKLKTRLYYLQKLLSLINIHNLTQENVSCLNTALVILISSFKKGELPQYLHFLSLSTVGCSIAGSKICFQEWKDTVSLLTSDDAENPCTIAFYALPSLPSRAP